MNRNRLMDMDPFENQAPENERLTVRIPPELKELLDQAADKREVTVNKLVTHILVNWFKK